MEPFNSPVRPQFRPRGAWTKPGPQFPFCTPNGQSMTAGTGYGQVSGGSAVAQGSSEFVIKRAPRCPGPARGWEKASSNVILSQPVQSESQHGLKDKEEGVDNSTYYEDVYFDSSDDEINVENDLPQKIYNLSDNVLQSPVRLQQLDPSTTFKIMYMYSFNHFHIVPSKAFIDEHFRIQEHICESLDESGKDNEFLTKCPNTGDLILISTGVDDLHERAVVEKVLSKTMVQVNCFDLGRRDKVPWKKLKPISYDVLKDHRKLGYDVSLVNNSNDPSLYTVTDGLAIIQEYEETLFNVSVLEYDEHAQHYVVELEYSKRDKLVKFSKIFKSTVAEWKWQALYSRFKNELELCNTNNYPNWIRSAVIMNRGWFFLHRYMKGVISFFENGPNTYRFNVSKICEERLMDDAIILHNQLSRYVSEVKEETSFYPVIFNGNLSAYTKKQNIESYSLVLLKAEAEAQNKPFYHDSKFKLGKDIWHRCIRVDNEHVYDIDIGKCHSLFYDVDKQRRFCPDFFKIPALSLRVHLKIPESISIDHQRKAFNNVMKLGKAIHFRILRFDESSLTYEVKCAEFESELKKL